MIRRKLFIEIFQVTRVAISNNSFKSIIKEIQEGRIIRLNKKKNNEYAQKELFTLAP